MTAFETRILNAIDRLTEPHGFTSLTRLRAELADLDHATLDQALIAMDRARQVQLEPNPNRIALTPEDRAAALWFANDHMHLVCTL